MKKFMLAVAVLAVASMSLVSCGGKNPADAEKLATETIEKLKAAKTPEEAKEIAEKAGKDFDAMLKNCKTAEDSAKVEDAAASVITAVMGAALGE